MLYHRVPPESVGDTLYPLNDLKQLPGSDYQHVSKREVKKYNNRPTVPEQYIPLLDCTWGDVIMLSAVSPKVLLWALITSGVWDWTQMSSYVIDPRNLDQNNLVVGRENPGTGLWDYTPFDDAQIVSYAEIPQTTHKHFRTMAKQGKKPFLFSGILHIMYRGTINVSGLRIETVYVSAKC